MATQDWFKVVIIYFDPAHPSDIKVDKRVCKDLKAAKKILLAQKAYESTKEILIFNESDELVDHIDGDYHDFYF